NYKKGDEVEAVVLAVDAERERISLGIKQLDKDMFSNFVATHPKGETVKGLVTEVENNKAIIQLEEGVEGVLRVQELARERIENAHTVLKVGEEIEAKVIGVDRKKRMINLSIKALLSQEEATAMQDYGNVPTAVGGTFGDLFKEQMESQ
ncbi:MAG: S1 RNA-binding domain-containing protein, partial [Thiotrichaceae bacterium]|nr:S1 RNA-binding domain-containing protein [Thiotrichaceae bacterium]